MFFVQCKFSQWKKILKEEKKNNEIFIDKIFVFSFFISFVYLSTFISFYDFIQ